MLETILRKLEKTEEDRKREENNIQKDYSARQMDKGAGQTDLQSKYYLLFLGIITSRIIFFIPDRYSH
jgi:hypothetical protein